MMYNIYNKKIGVFILDWSTLTNSDWIAVWSTIATLFISLVAIIISLASLIQNRNIIKETNNPHIVIYADTISTGYFAKYLIVKNIGNSSAKITNISFSDSLHDLEKQFLNALKDSYIVAGQTILNGLIDEDIPSHIEIEIEYENGRFKKKEKFHINMDRLDKTFYLKHEKQKSNAQDNVSRGFLDLTNTLENGFHDVEKRNL